MNLPTKITFSRIIATVLMLLTLFVLSIVKPVINPIATPPKRINNSSAFALALLNLIRPSATAIVAILTAPVVELSKNKDTIDTTAVTIIGVKIEVTKIDFVALNLNEAITV